MISNSTKPKPAVLESSSTMKDLLKQYATYNVWANQKITDLIVTLSEEQQHREIASSFSSLYKTIHHMWDAESIWWQRMKLQERFNLPMETFKGSMQELANELLQQNRQWQQWVNTATDPMLDHVFQYFSQKKESFKQPIFQMLLHVFNHGTYHRGQLVNMLRQLGIEKIPPTDFSLWSRKK